MVLQYSVFLRSPRGQRRASEPDSELWEQHEIAPVCDEIVLPKSSSSVFISTLIDYILRNLGGRQVVIIGPVADQCVESAIRDACDLGWLVTHVTDACTSYTEARRAASINAIKGYCRQVTTDALCAELQG